MATERTVSDDFLRGYDAGARDCRGSVDAMDAVKRTLASWESRARTRAVARTLVSADDLFELRRTLDRGASPAPRPRESPEDVESRRALAMEQELAAEAERDAKAK